MLRSDRRLAVGSAAAAAAAAGAQDSPASSKQLLDAGQLIERELDHDEKRDELLDELQSHDNGYYHYEKNRLQLRRTVPIPQAIIDQYDHLECKSFVGLFPEIHRAFITIDNKLFLWNYYDGSDFYLLDELSQIIISAALLKPKPGVFVASIQHVLVLTTPVEILMFAVKFDGDNVHNGLQLFPTQFTVPSDNVHMTSVVGTDQGRIFLCGRDGGIYELDYWSGDDAGWFGGSQQSGGAVTSFTTPFSSLFGAARKKCRKVAHSTSRFKLVRSILPTFLGGIGSGTGSGDQLVESIAYDGTRNFLFTLCNEQGSAGTTRPVISVYELGADGWAMRLRSKCDRIAEGARAAMRQLSADMYADLAGPQGAELKLVHLAAIPSHESATIVLLAVTPHGHRLYFDFEPRTLKLRVKFVRLCPPALSAEELHRSSASSAAAASRAAKVEPRFAKGTSPSLVHSAYYKDGILLMADAGRSALGDSLVSVHKDPRASTASAAANGGYNARSWASSAGGASAASVLNEAVDSFDFESRIADLGEVHQDASLNLLSSALFARPQAQGARYAVANGAGNGRLVQPLRALHGLPELATQHLTPNRQLLVLTSSSLLTLAKIRPLDELKHALAVKKRTNDESALQAIWTKYGAKESCAMALILVGASYITGANGSVQGDFDEVEKSHLRSGQLSIASPNKLLGSGAASSSGANSATSLAGVSDDQLRKGAKQAFFRFGELAAEAAVYRGGVGAGVAAQAGSHAAMLEGVALYLSRWLRSHWDWSLCVALPPVDGAIGASAAQLSFRFSKDFYIELLQPLVKLQRFLEENQRLLVRDVPHSAASSAHHTTSTTQFGAQSGLADPARMELESLNALSSLLDLTIEIFNLLVLFLTNAPAASSSSEGSQNGAAAATMLLRSSAFLSSNDLQMLVDMKFYDVLTTTEGHALVRKCINTLACVGAGSATASMSGVGLDDLRKRGFDDDGASASSNHLIAQLHSACPTFFGSSELLYWNALDSLKLAKQHWNMTGERASHVGRALSTYASFLGSATFPLEDVADKLKGVYEYAGLVQLAMRRAEMLERREVPRPKTSLANTSGMGLGGAGHVLGDDEYYAQQRKRCFDVILDTMNILMFGIAAGKSLASSSTERSSNGVNSTTLTTNGVDSSIPPLSSEQLAAGRDKVVSLILSSRDSQLHGALYSWYIEKGLLDALYAIQSEHLIRFLTSSEQYVLLLKDYYLRNERWHEAALLLNFLSLKQGPQYALKDRIDFLTRALHCARNYQAQLQKHGAAMSSPLGRGGKRAGSLGGLQGNTSVAEQQDLIDQLKDRIEIAKIQGDIYKKLQIVLEETYSDEELRRIETQASRRRAAAAGPSVKADASSPKDADVAAFHQMKESISGALADLDTSLLDIQALYLFCTNFGLWETCLRIFHFSNESQRSDVICALWKNIFRAEMTACKRAGEDWGLSVRTKFVELSSGAATCYRDVPYMYPLDFLIRELEVNNFRYRSEPDESYVASTLLATGIAPKRLLQEYDGLIDTWEQSSSTAADAHATNAQGQSIQTFLYWSVWHILRAVLESERASRRAHGGGASSAAGALNLFNKCLTNLRTLPPGADTQRLHTRFQELYEVFLKHTR